MAHHRIETVIVGGGQVGLAVGYQLKKRRRPFVILDASQRIGDAWRKRWDSLMLFTPARYNGLPGMRFPATGSSVVSKDQMADFLDEYAAHFELPVKTSQRVDRLQRLGDRYLLNVGGDTYEADNVVVAMANYQKPKIPPFAAQLDANIVQLHSSQYKRPDQLGPGDVLVVGTANSGADIAFELSAHHHTLLAGNDVGQVPFRIEPWLSRQILVRLVRFVGHHVLRERFSIGRKVKAKMLRAGAPRVRVKMQDLLDRGVERVPRVQGVEDGRPVLEDGRTLEVLNVVWCTGYTPGFSWIDLPVFVEGEHPRHVRGVVADYPGLYFVGLHYLHAATSATVTGFQRDALHVVKHLNRRMTEQKDLAPAPSRALARLNP